ncbi:MAG: cyclase family protein [Chloroflexota bacterium]|nr:cyclase family protein [Chloroflexota bacterium]
MARFIDLSHRLTPGMPSYPGLLEPKFRTWFTHEESAARGTYSSGTTFQIATYELGGNTGTYVDAPFHRHPDGPDLADLPLEKLADVPGIVVQGAADGAVPWTAFEGLDLRGKAVLVHTGWSERWGGPDYFRSGPYLSEDVCHRLVEAGTTLVGIDCANIDNMSDPARPAHTVLLAAGIPIVEHLRGLDQLPNEGFRFFAVPPAIEGGTSFAVRAFALLEE